MSPQPPTAHPEPAVRREVLLDAPVDDVWRALADDAGLAGWLADEVDLDVVPGATGTVRDAGGPPRPVRVDEVREGRGLSLVWSDEADVETLVDIALAPADAPGAGRGRTRVVIVELPVVAVSAVSIGADRSLVGVAGPGSASAGGAATASASAGRALAGVR
jgi:uncharacterized protein YndB with AHSA1/START domain